MAFALRTLSTALLALLCASCGSKSLTTPTDLLITTYTAGEDIRLTFVMTNCSDTCSEYEVPECSTSQEGSTIEVDVSVGFADKDGVDPASLEGCALTCGPQVIAHCDIGSLQEGSYTVEADGFERTINVVPPQ